MDNRLLDRMEAEIRKFFKDPNGEKAHECSKKIRSIVAGLEDGPEQVAGVIAAVNEFRRNAGMKMIGPQWLQDCSYEAEAMSKN